MIKKKKRTTLKYIDNIPKPTRSIIIPSNLSTMTFDVKYNKAPNHNIRTLDQNIPLILYHLKIKHTINDDSKNLTDTLNVIQ